MLFHKPLSKGSIYSFTCTKEKGKKKYWTQEEKYIKKLKRLSCHTELTQYGTDWDSNYNVISLRYLFWLVTWGQKHTKAIHQNSHMCLWTERGQYGDNTEKLNNKEVIPDTTSLGSRLRINTNFQVTTRRTQLDTRKQRQVNITLTITHSS